MSAPVPTPLPPTDLFRFLPAIYRTGGNDPFTALVSALAETSDALERRLEGVPALFDPRSAVSAQVALSPTAPPDAFLDMLALWVAFDPDVLGPAPTGDDLARARRAKTLQHLVEQAAPLHATRGTLAGLRYLVGVLMEVEVDVLEWCWPAALQPGVTGQLGVDTLLVGEPPLRRCVTLVFDSPALRAAVAGLAGTPGASVLTLSAGDARLGTLILERGTAGAADSGILQVLQQLHTVLDRELPAHLARYVGFAVDVHDAQDDLKPFVVEVTSTLGEIRIMAEA